jgi:hypothetical protein
VRVCLFLAAVNAKDVPLFVIVVAAWVTPVILNNEVNVSCFHGACVCGNGFDVIAPDTTTCLVVQYVD